MGTIEHRSALESAARFTRARDRAKATSAEAEAWALDRRRDFVGRVPSGFLESIIEDSDLLPVRHFALGQLAAAPVGRIFLHAPDGSGSGFATGFLIAPGLLLTNHHVLQTPAWARAATLTMDAEDDLDGLPRPPRVFKFAPDQLFLADPALDFCCVAVAPRAVDGTPLSGYGYLRLFGATGKVTAGEYATIVQHPDGRQKHLASRNNRITVYVYDDDLDESERAANNFLYYSTDTLPGSSGAPVFNDQWYVVALHRRGVPATKVVRGREVILRTNGKPAAPDDPEEVIRFVSNEGVRISRILRRLGTLAESGTAAQRSAAPRLLEAITRAAGAPEDGPFARPTARIAILTGPAGQGAAGGPGAEAFEIVRRKASEFPESVGYNLLPFRHFSTAMHARRRLPVFAAVNIDGRNKPEGSMPGRPGWSLDPRIDDAHQPDDSIFSSMLHRGHMAARDHVYWGKTAKEIEEADRHSFTLTNVCPQIRAFNASKEWYELERQIIEEAEDEQRRVTVFLGPILRATDPSYDDLRGPGSSAEFGTRIRIPLRFWKIVCWLEGGLRHRAFLLDQRDELGAAGPLELSFIVPKGVTESTVSEIEELTGLTFPGLQ